MKKIVSLVALFFCVYIMCIPPGLPNFGNTCYINAGLQALNAIPPLSRAILSHRYLSSELFASQYQHLIYNFEFNPHTFDRSRSRARIFLGKFVDKARDAVADRTKRTGCSQEDSNEFLTLLIEQLRTNPEVENLLTTQIDTIVSCPEDGDLRVMKTDQESHIFINLPVTTEGKVLNNLPEALNNYFQPEVMEEFRGRHYCIRQSFLHNYPPILSIVLKKFRYTRSGVEKIDDPVTMPLEINMQPYTPDRRDTNSNYRLNSFIVQVGGSATGGHYIAYVWFQNEWYLCDDLTIQRVSQDTALEEARDAYIFFYQRKDLYSEEEFEERSKEEPVESSLTENLLTLRNNLQELLEQLKK